MRCLKTLGPQMNANKRKFYFAGFTNYSVVSQSLGVSSVSIFEKILIIRVHLRSFAENK